MRNPILIFENKSQKSEMKLETERLTIIPLDKNNLVKYLLLDFSLETSLGVKHISRRINERVKTTIQSNILPLLDDPNNNYLFHTIWIIIDKINNSIVAEIFIKGRPNEKGEIEIGYGTFPDFQGKGYMTESVKVFCKWATNQDDIKSIIAETDPDNEGSKKVLRSCDFLIYKQTPQDIFWRFEKNE